MTIIDRSALLPHAAAEVFELVADIERYPQFLKGCVAARVLERRDTTVMAQLDLSRAGISHSFVTRNTLTPPERIELDLVEGPFERFAGHWEFRALAANASKVILTLDFQLKSGLMHVAVGHLFDRVALDLVDAVVQRAAQVYGRAVV